MNRRHKQAAGPQRRVRSAFIALPLLAGCTVGPDYVRPDAAPSPQAYKEADGWRRRATGRRRLRGKWWAASSTIPMLDALMAQVRVSNQNLTAAEAASAQARALVAVGARRVLSASLSASGFTVAQPRRSAAAASVGAQSRRRDLQQLPDIGLDASWELDLWGRIRRAVEASDAGGQASAADRRGARLPRRRSSRTDYFQLRVLDAHDALLERHGHGLRAARCNDAEPLRRGRRRRASDVVQAETQLAATRGAGDRRSASRARSSSTRSRC